MARFGENAAAAALGGAVLAACSFPADYSGTRYRCGPAGECPGGFACNDGYCEKSDPPADGGGPDSGGGEGGESDAGGEPDTGPGGDAGVGDCSRSSAVAFVDDFTTGDAWEITNQDGCAVVFDGSAVQLEAVANRCLARTVDELAFDGRVFVRALNPQQGLVESGFGIHHGDTSLVALRVLSGLELTELTDDGTRAVRDSIPFDPALDRFWAVRPGVVDDRIHWETSVDGIEWVERGVYELAGVSDGTCVRLEFDALGTGEPGPVASFDDLNLNVSTTRARLSGRAARSYRRYCRY